MPRPLYSLKIEHALAVELFNCWLDSICTPFCKNGRTPKQIIALENTCFRVLWTNEPFSSWSARITYEEEKTIEGNVARYITSIYTTLQDLTRQWSSFRCLWKHTTTTLPANVIHTCKSLCVVYNHNNHNYYVELLSRFFFYLLLLSHNCHSSQYAY